MSLDVVGGSAGDYAAQITAVNGYQLNLLMYGDSNDGDFAGLSTGDSDALLLTYDWREAAGDPSALAALVGQAAQLSQADWTPDSWQILAAKLEAANTLLVAPYATKAQYDQAAAELQLAMDGLAKVPPAKSDEQPGAGGNGADGNDDASGGSGEQPGGGGEQPDGNDGATGGNGSDGGDAADVGATGNGAAASNGPAAANSSNAAPMAQTGDAAGNVAAVSVIAAVVAATTAIGARIRRRLAKHLLR